MKCFFLGIDVCQGCGSLLELGAKNPEPELGAIFKNLGANSRTLF
jgi:hypothetical protein